MSWRLRTQRVQALESGVFGPIHIKSSLSRIQDCIFILVLGLLGSVDPFQQPLSYPLRYRKGFLIETIAPLIEVHWRVCVGLLSRESSVWCRADALCLGTWTCWGQSYHFLNGVQGAQQYILDEAGCIWEFPEIRGTQSRPNRMGSRFYRPQNRTPQIYGNSHIMTLVSILLHRYLDPFPQHPNTSIMRL